MNKSETPPPPEGFQPIISENPFGQAVGPIFEKKEKDAWVRGFRIEEKHTNRAKIAHGGALMTFADIILATAVWEELQAPFVTIQMESQFVSPARIGDWVEGRAAITKRTKDLVFVNGLLSAAEKPVLSVSGIFKIL